MEVKALGSSQSLYNIGARHLKLAKDRHSPQATTFGLALYLDIIKHAGAASTPFLHMKPQ